MIIFKLWTFIMALNFFSHFQQLNGFPLVWICSWVFKAHDVVNFLSNFKQLNGFPLVWILSCIFKWLACVSFLLHLEQPNGFSSVWILLRVFKWHTGVNCSSHFEQLNSFSSAWILSWAFKLWSRLNLFEQTKQLDGFYRLISLSLMRQISIGQCVSVKYFHDKGVAWSQTKPSIPESTQMRIHTAAQSVIRHWPHQELCRPTIRSLRMRNHSTGQCVIRNSVKWVFCTNAHKKLIWFHMKELSEHWEQLPYSNRISQWLTEFGPLPWQAKQTVSALCQL